MKSHKRGVRDVKISHFNSIDLIDQDVVKIGRIIIRYWPERGGVNKRALSQVLSNKLNSRVP